MHVNLYIDLHELKSLKDAGLTKSKGRVANQPVIDTTDTCTLTHQHEGGGVTDQRLKFTITERGMKNSSLKALDK